MTKIIKLLALKYRYISHYLVGIDWIVSPVGEACKPIPIYYVEEGNES